MAEYGRHPWHIALRIGNVFIDGSGSIVTLAKARRAYHRRYRRYIGKHKMFIGRITKEDLSEWLWVDHPRFVAEIEQGIRKHL